MDTFYPYLSEPWALALAATLLHSIWQGAVVAFFTAVIFFLKPDMHPRSRYVICLISLFSIPMISVITYIVEWSSRSTMLALHQMQTRWIALSPVTSEMYASGNGGFWQQIIQFVAADQRFPAAIITLWLFGVLLLSLRFLGGYYQAQKIRRNTEMLPESWKTRFEELAVLAGINRNVRFMTATYARVPFTMGWIRPIVVIPASLLTGFSPLQIEMILLHELAHIRRLDYLANMLQSVVEILFFYHPAVWWLSENVHREREHCCDSRVLELRNAPVPYAKALYTLASSLTLTPSAPALAISGNGELNHRIHRILNKKMKQTPHSFRFAASAVLALGIGTFLALHPVQSRNTLNQETHNPEIKTANLPINLQPFPDTGASDGLGATQADILEIGSKMLLHATVTDSIPPKNKITHIKYENGNLIELHVNGKAVPKADFGKYKKEIEALPPPPPIPPAPPTIEGDVKRTPPPPTPPRQRPATDAQSKTPPPPVQKVPAPAQVTPAPPTIELKRYEGTKVTHLKRDPQGNIVELHINGKAIPKADFGKYKKEIEAMPPPPPIPPAPPTIKGDVKRTPPPPIPPTVSPDTTKRKRPDSVKVPPPPRPPMQQGQQGTSI